MRIILPQLPFLIDRQRDGWRDHDRQFTRSGEQCCRPSYQTLAGTGGEVDDQRSAWLQKECRTNRQSLAWTLVAIERQLQTVFQRRVERQVWRRGPTLAPIILTKTSLKRAELVAAFQPVSLPVLCSTQPKGLVITSNNLDV